MVCHLLLFVLWIIMYLCVLQSKIPAGIKSGNYNKVRPADKV